MASTWCPDLSDFRRDLRPKLRKPIRVRCNERMANRLRVEDARPVSALHFRHPAEFNHRPSAGTGTLTCGIRGEFFLVPLEAEFDWGTRRPLGGMFEVLEHLIPMRFHTSEPGGHGGPQPPQYGSGRRPCRPLLMSLL